MKAIAAALSDCDTVEEIAWWAEEREAWPRRFLVLRKGIPSADTSFLAGLLPKESPDEVCILIIKCRCN